MLFGVNTVYLDVNEYKVKAQNVWAHIYLSVNVIEYLTIIPWVRVGYEMVNSHIQQARVE